MKQSSSLLLCITNNFVEKQTIFPVTIISKGICKDSAVLLEYNVKKLYVSAFFSL